MSYYEVSAYGPNARINIESVDNSINIVYTVYIYDDNGYRLSDLDYHDFKVLEFTCLALAPIANKCGSIRLPGHPVTSTVERAESELGIDEEAVQESLQMLLSRGYIEVSSKLMSRILSCSPTLRGWETFIRSQRRDFSGVIEQVGECILAHFDPKSRKSCTLKTLVDATGYSFTEVEVVIEILEQSGFLRISRTIGNHVNPGGYTAVFVRGPELKRWLQNQ